MGLESATYISDLVSTNPTSTDVKSQGDDHIRLLKSTVKATFPNITGAVTATQAELNLLDGVTASTAELNIMDGVTATAAELNVLDGITATVTELNYTDGVTSAIQAQLDAKAPLASPALTGTPTAPTATTGTATTQLATTAFVGATAFSAALPSQTGNSGKLVTTNGTDASWTAIKTINSASLLGAGNINTGITNIVTATTATTLTSTPTLLRITPAGYGVRVTLPDATTCTEGGPVHIIDNQGAYPILLDNNSGTLLGFVFGGVVSHIGLADNATAAGVWSPSNVELVGASAQLLSANMLTIQSVIALDSDRDFILSNGASNYSYGVVYRKSTNAFGAVATIRAAAVAGNHRAILQTTNQVLVVSCDGTTGFEAVICSINAGTDAITPNTAATATLSANINVFADGCGLIAVGTSFITSYTVTTPAAQIREITVSGTTPTISAATVLSGSAGGLIVAGSATVVIAVSTATTSLYTRPYSIGGLAAGTGTTTTAGTMTLNKLAPTGGGRWWCVYNDGGTTVKGAVISLSATTTTISAATGFSASSLQDAIAVGTTKLAILNYATTNHCNIITDSAGTASAGTAITLSSQTVRACLYASGTDVVVAEGTTAQYVHVVDCSGASPVLSKTFINQQVSNTETYGLSQQVSDSVLSKSPYKLHGSRFAQINTRQVTTANFLARVNKETFTMQDMKSITYQGSGAYRGTAESEVWIADGATVITKMELATGAL